MNHLTLKVSLYSAAAFVLSAVPALAQQSGHVSVKVPFKFIAGSTALPAGDWDFQEQPNGVIVISSASQHRAIAVLTNSHILPRPNSLPSVKFDKNGNIYSLTEVDLQGEPGRMLVRSDRDTNGGPIAAKMGMTNASSKGLQK